MNYDGLSARFERLEAGGNLQDPLFHLAKSPVQVLDEAQREFGPRNGLLPDADDKMRTDGFDGGRGRSGRRHRESVGNGTEDPDRPTDAFRSSTIGSDAVRAGDFHRTTPISPGGAPITARIERGWRANRRTFAAPSAVESCLLADQFRQSTKSRTRTARIHR
jgi:hypothetical protein